MTFYDTFSKMCFYKLKKPINVLGNSSSSHHNGNKINTSLFVQKPYLRANYIETNTEEDIDMKNQYRIINRPDPLSKREAASKNYIDNIFWKWYRLQWC